MFGVGSVLLSKHGRRRNFSRHPIGPQGLGLSVTLSAPGSENLLILVYWVVRSNWDPAGRPTGLRSRAQKNTLRPI
jgi:hypothetical protein